MNDGRGLAIDTTHDFLYAIGALKQRLFKFNYAGTMLKEMGLADRQLQRQDRPQVQLDPVPGRRLGHRQRLRRRHVGIPDLGLRLLRLQPLAGFTSTPSPPADGGYTQQTGVAIVPATAPTRSAST